MTTKNYLNRAYNLERVVNNKLTELSTLQTIAEKVTASFSDIPQSGTRNVRKHEEVMAKIIDLQNEISGDVANLIDIKRETMNIIKTVEKASNPSLSDGEVLLKMDDMKQAIEEKL